MKRWLILLRSQNLLLVALTQTVVWGALPADQPSFFYRLLLVLSTVFITAGGYLINDWYDVEIDQINKPQKALLQNSKQKKEALLAWIFCSILGLVLAVLPALHVGVPALLILQFATVLLLWWYAARGKRLPIIGNVLVALLTALSIELPQFYLGDFNEVSIDFLAVFAFLLTWAREIVKDLQDEDGDRVGGCKTLPILAGRKVSVGLASVLSSAVLLGVLMISVTLADLSRTYWGFGIGFLLLLFLVVPLIVWTRRLWNSYTPAEYHKSSSFLKAVMVIGILFFVCFLIL